MPVVELLHDCPTEEATGAIQAMVQSILMNTTSIRRSPNNGIRMRLWILSSSTGVATKSFPSCLITLLRSWIWSHDNIHQFWPCSPWMCRISPLLTLLLSKTFSVDLTLSISISCALHPIPSANLFPESLLQFSDQLSSLWFSQATTWVDQSVRPSGILPFCLKIQGTSSNVQELSHSGVLFIHYLTCASLLVELRPQNVQLQEKRDMALIVESWTSPCWKSWILTLFLPTSSFPWQSWPMCSFRGWSKVTWKQRAQNCFFLFFFVCYLVGSSPNHRTIKTN